MTWPNREMAFVPNPENAMRVSTPDFTRADLDRLALVGKCYIERYMEQCWIENDSDGFTGWRWDKFGKDLIIVSAANRYGNIITIGPRHYSNGMQIAIDALGGTKLLQAYAGNEYEQGFIDQYSTFHDRKEAWIIAEKQGQIRFPDIGPSGTLYSEHLY